MAAPGTSILGHVQSGGDKYRYLAPEIQWRDDGETDKILPTEESDVYGMGMVAYEASRCLALPGQGLNLTFVLRSLRGTHRTPDAAIPLRC